MYRQPVLLVLPSKLLISPFGMKCTFSALPNSFSRKASHALEAVYCAMGEFSLFLECSRQGFTHSRVAYSVNCYVFRKSFNCASVCFLSASNVVFPPSVSSFLDKAFH